jgi:hypothetical protein
MYEIQSARYAGPDCTTRLDTIELTSDGDDRVLIAGVRGEAPPPQLKVSLNSIGGFRNEVEFVVVGLDIEEKADLVRSQFESWLAKRPAQLEWDLVRLDRVDADTEQRASALLRCVARDTDPKIVGRAFSSTAIELGLASYPGFFVTAPPRDASPYGVFTAGYVDAQEVPHTAVLPDGSRIEIASAMESLGLEEVPAPQLPPPPPEAPIRTVPLGSIALARSGDKGGNANLGLWVRTDEQWRWLVHTLTVEEFQRLLPETASLKVIRHVLPNLRALNFVVEGLLGEGVAYNARFDPQAKGLAEWLRARHIDIPEQLLG